MRDWIRVRQRPVRLVAAVVVIVLAAGIAGIGIWRPDIPGLSNPFRVAHAPAYLDPDAPLVRSARNGAHDQLAVLRRVRDAMHAAIPTPDALWATRLYGLNPELIRLWIDHHQVQFQSFPPFEVPVDPSWSEDPDNDIAWQASYQSLAWLRAVEQAYVQTGDGAYLDQVRAYLLDWINDAATEPPPSVRTWYDDAVSIRTDTIVALLQGDLWGRLTDSELATVLSSLEEHGQLLHSYLDDREFKGHNHDLFHALSLYNLAVALPELRGASTWRADARARISSLLPELVDTAEGASLEEAAAYHFVVLQSYADAEDFLQRHGDGLSSQELSVLGSMTAFGALLLAPNGTLPAIGDTPYASGGGSALLSSLASRGITSDAAAFVLSRGVEGTQPPDAVFYPAAGYAIVRPTWSPGAAWADDLQLVVETTNRRSTHGHADALSFVLNAAGGPLLVDSGGPYLYGNSTHQDFVGPGAHNTVVDAGRTGGRGPVESLLEEDHPAYTLVGGRVDLSAGSADRRLIVLVKPGLLIVVDQLAATDGQAHDYGLLYHLPPDAVATMSKAVDAAGSPGSGSGQAIAGTVRAGPAALGYRIVGSAPLAADVVAGQEDPLLGWVTPAYGVKVAAPVLRAAQLARSGWYVSAFEPATANPVPPTVSVTDAGGGLRIEVEGQTGSAVIEISGSGQVTVEAG
jgi:Heparinase II/III N-terminus/Heparinase II/III-like protein